MKWIKNIIYFFIPHMWYKTYFNPQEDFAEYIEIYKSFLWIHKSVVRFKLADRELRREFLNNLSDEDKERLKTLEPEDLLRTK